MQHYLSDSRSLHWEPWRTSLIIFLPSLSSPLQPSRGTGSAEPISGSWRPHWRRGAKLGLGRDSMLPWRGESRAERARSPASTSNGGLEPCCSGASRTMMRGRCVCAVSFCLLANSTLLIYGMLLEYECRYGVFQVLLGSQHLRRLASVLRWACLRHVMC